MVDRDFVVPKNVVPIRRGAGGNRPRPILDVADRAQNARTPELALVLGILSALSIGTQRDQALFRLIRYEVGRLAHYWPDDEALRDACNVIAQLQEANRGR